MDKKENKPTNKGFMEEANYKNRVLLFHDKLKRHLSSEYFYVTERRDQLESEMAEIKFELEQKDKKLFKKTEQKDTRQYFSPLNLHDINESQKDERMKQLSMDLKKLEEQVDKCNSILDEIKDILSEMEDMAEENN